MIVGYLISAIALALVIVYVLQLRKWRKAWNNAPVHVPNSDVINATVIIPVHNEIRHIEDTFNSLMQQFIGANEIIFVCDNCTDGTDDFLSRLIFDRRDCKLIVNAGTPGKKEAQRLGIEAASNDVVIFIDADCTLPQWWHSAIASYHCKYRPDLLIAPVFMRGDASTFQHIIELEFLALQMCTAGAALSGTPFMCNGANLSLPKRLYKRRDKSDVYVSGDDMFLLADIKKHDGKIAYIKSHDAIVTTPTPHSLLSYLKQRTRWLRKATGYTDITVVAIGLLIFFVNVAVPLLFGLSFVDVLYIVPAVTVFITKLIAEYWLLKAGEKFWRVIVDFESVFILALVYPINVVFILVLTLFRNPKKW
jgi:cellulose synthase/poly-beta-1,6-N-acetylglucosamine synthase-like glycosyltransferase